ncbi:MAG: hypothetical protein ACOC5E_00200 [Acidobacteriota bacterium]
MSDEPRGVGVNGETDDFAARYDRMVDGRTGPLAIKTTIALLILLALVALGGLLL